MIRDKKTNKTKGFGFVSFKEPGDFTKAMREMNGKYVGSRPIKVGSLKNTKKHTKLMTFCYTFILILSILFLLQMRKSNWKDRNIEVVRQKQKQKQEMGFKW